MATIKEAVDQFTAEDAARAIELSNEIVAAAQPGAGSIPVQGRDWDLIVCGLRLLATLQEAAHPKH